MGSGLKARSQEVERWTSWERECCLNKNLSSDSRHPSKSNKSGDDGRTSNLSTWEVETVRFYEFQASLIYSENSSSNSSSSVLCLRMQSGQGRIQPAKSMPSAPQLPASLQLVLELGTNKEFA